MDNITALFFLAPSLAVSTATRVRMIRSVLEFSPSFSQIWSFLALGATRDVLLLLFPLAGIMTLRHFGVGGAPLLLLQLLFGLVTGATAVFAVADHYIFASSYQRFFQILVKETRVKNILVSATRRQLLALLFVLLGAAMWLYASACLPYGIPLIPLLAVIAATGCVFCYTRAYISKIESYDNREYISFLLKERFQQICLSPAVNFFAVCLGVYMTNRKNAPKVLQPYAEEEERLLTELQLINTPKYRDASSDQTEPPFKRVLFISLESVAQKMLPFYNPRIPPETMPFLSSLIENNPALHNLHTANIPTDPGLLALHASRLSIEYDMSRIDTPLDTLARLLQEKGFATYSLLGVTGSYGYLTPLMTRILGFQHFWAREKLESLYPQALVCPNGWGLADSAVFSAGVNLLAEHRDKKIFLDIRTANTHPLFFYTVQEKDFPESIRKTKSHMLRSLYGADRDLMMLFRMLGKAKLLTDETLIILTADHSPNHCREYLHYTGSPDFFPDKTPCVFITANKNANPFATLAPTVPADQLDILPTLADALHLRKPETLWGRSLFTGGKKTIVQREGHIVKFTRGQQQYVLDLAGTDTDATATALRKWFHNGTLAPYSG
ncbi:MAG: hypothetical protein DELT_00370 [Desulfovibrio sp.]